MNRIIICAAVLMLFSAPAFSMMDCPDMFMKAEDKIAMHKTAPIEDKVKLYRMAADGYEMCKKGEESQAKDFFRQVFDTADKM